MAAGGSHRFRLGVVAGVGGLLVIGGVVCVVLVMAVVMFFGSTPDVSPGSPVAGCGNGSGSGSTVAALPMLDAGPQIATLDADQTGNARTIVQVASLLAAAHGLDATGTRRAATIGIMTALQESTLRNLNYGDRDSLGLFQQRAGWAGATERTTPSAAATMFYTGGHAGQRGLFGVPGWQSMPLWAAAQAVQVSAFPNAYAKWERTADTVVGALLGGSTQPLAPPKPARTIALENAACAAGAASLDGTDDAPAQASTKGWVLPLPPGSYTPTSPFGWRVHPILHDWKLHTGQDLGAPMGTRVYAAADGRVSTAGLNGTAGNQVILDHGGGVQSVYDHLSVISVAVGTRVRAGEVLGRVGSTGRSTGAHLHFEIRLRGQPVDPVPFLRARGVQLVTR
jgi:murein DD-endopeptidase MepM/ murein hydrolase activator NlpD